MNQSVSYDAFLKQKKINEFVERGFTKDQSKTLVKALYSNLGPDKTYIVRKQLIQIKKELNFVKQELEKSELRLVIKLGSIVTLVLSIFCYLKLL